MPSTWSATLPPVADDRVPLLIALGANLKRRNARGAWRSPRETLRDVLPEMVRHGLVIDAASAVFETPPLGGPTGQPPYANQVLAARFAGSPRGALELLMKIEHRFGRQRCAHERHAPRTLDLDLLDFAGRILPDVASWHRATAADDAPVGPLVLPHPRMHRRAFVLVPLATIRPDWRHPVFGKSTRALLAALDPAELAAIRPWPAMGPGDITTKSGTGVNGPPRSDD